MIRLFIADDHPVVREGLKRIVAEQGDFQLEGEATSGHELLARIGDAPVDVLLLDVSMPGPGFLETLRRVREARDDVAVLVLSVHPEDQYALRALRAGASGYLTKDQTPTELANAIRRVHGGGQYVSAALAEQLAAEMAQGSARPSHESLSDREFQVLRALARGESVKRIAHELKLSPKTVSTYRTRLLAKLGLDSNAELVRYAVRHGLVEE